MCGINGQIDILSLKGKPVCIIPANGMGLLMYEVLTANGADVACVCDSAFYEDFAEKEDFNRDFKKYKLKNSREAFKDYPSAAYVVAASHFKHEICNMLEQHGIEDVFYSEQILRREHLAFIEMLPQKGYNNSNSKNYRAQAMIDARKCLFKPCGAGECINKMQLYFNDKYMLNYKAENDEIFCDMKEYDTVGELIKDCGLLFDKYKFSGEIFTRYNDAYNHANLKKVIQYLNSRNESIGYITAHDMRTGFDHLKLVESDLLSEFDNMLLLFETYEILNEAETYLTLPPICLINRSPYEEVNDELKAVFIHIPKTAGTTISKILLRTVGHLSALDLLRTDSKKFHDYFKFSIVRNPWDRLVSAFFYVCRGGEMISGNTDAEKKSNFKKFVLELNNSNLNGVKPQHTWLCDEEGNLIVDYVGRFEKLQESCEYIGKRLGLEISGLLPKINVSERGSYQEYYDDESREIVREFYKKDIELFGYEFEEGTT